MPKRRRRGLGIFLFILVFLAGAALSLFFIAVLPILERQTAESRHASTVWQETESGEISDSIPWRNRYSRIIVYDLNRQVLYYTINKSDKTADDLASYTGRWMERVFAGGSVIAVTKDQFEDTFLYLWLTSGTPIIENGEVIGAVFLSQDIQILQNSVIYFMILYTAAYWIGVVLFTVYRRKKRRLEEKERQYVANITHQLKTPVAAIGALTESLSDGMAADPEKQQAYYGRILKETQNETRLINEILELSRLQSGERRFDKAAVSPREIFEGVTEKFSVICELSGLSFEADKELSKLPRVYTNAAAAAEITEILLENAVKYTPEGGRVRLGCSSGNIIRITVSDNGPGISEEEAGHIFDRFYRGAQSGGTEGSGLGLAIAKEMAGRIGETLSAKNGSGGGTEFCLTLHRAK